MAEAQEVYFARTIRTSNGRLESQRHIYLLQPVIAYNLLGVEFLEDLGRHRKFVAHRGDVLHYCSQVANYRINFDCSTSLRDALGVDLCQGAMLTDLQNVTSFLSGEADDISD